VKKKAKVSLLQRVYYETSALLPALALTINFEGGSVTEYLGDGLLALFKVDPEDKSKAIYAAHRAAKDSIGPIRHAVNSIIRERYSLPEIDLGVGLAISKTLVTLIGIKNEKHPKAIGECIFRASKLSSERNLIIVDENMKINWPTAKYGTLKFHKKKVRDVNGYHIE
jgi:hypothetical protein